VKIFPLKDIGASRRVRETRIEETQSRKERHMKRIGKVVIAAMAVGALVVGLAGCKKEGPVERAGKAVDKAGENIKDAVKDATK